VLLTDREVVTVSVKKNANTEQVYTAVVEKIKMRKDVAKYFALFEIVEYNFGTFPPDTPYFCILTLLLFREKTQTE
jgi:Ras association (RalGDS/AF-6) domain